MGRYALPSGYGHLCVLTFFAVAGQAQVNRFENRPVADIQYSPAVNLDAGHLAKAVKVRKGAPYRSEDISASVDGLFATGRFTDIVVDAEASANGVIVRFVTEAAWFVGGIAVQGKVSTPPNRAQIESAAPLTLGAPFRNEDLTSAVNAVKEVLKNNGLYEAEVTTELARDPDAQQIFVTIKVEEHKRAKYEMPILQAAAQSDGSADRAIPAPSPAKATSAVDLKLADLKLSDGTIVHATGWRVPLIHWWKQVTGERTRKGVDGVLAKYHKQKRLTAHVEIAKLDYDAARRRVRPTLDIAPGPKVDVKAVEAKVSQRTLKKYVPVFQENALDNDLLAEGKRNLTSYFQSSGYYDVDVDVRQLPPQNDLETVEYVISEGQRYKLVKISFAGNHYFDEDTLRERMYMDTAGFLTMRHGRYSETFRHKDEDQIAALYKSNGFHDVKVTSTVDRHYQGKDNEVAVTMRIEEGPQWVVDHVALNGMIQLKAGDLKQRLASSPGQPFADVNLATDRNVLLTYYYERGFPDADVTVAWTPGSSPNHINVTYNVTEGGRKFVRNVVTSGLQTTRRSIVEKQITLKPGEPLSPVEQTQIQKRLYDLGVFARVDTAIENPGGDTEHKFVLYNVEEANRYILGLGFGVQAGTFGTPSATDLTSPGGTKGFSPQASLDLTRLNLWGLGHSVSLHTLYSTLEKSGSINYLVPRLGDVLGRDLTFRLLYDNALNVTTFASRREEASVQLANRFSKSITGTFQLAYRRVSVSTVVIPTLLIPQLLQPVKLGLVSATFEQDRRDDKADPHRGIYNTFDVALASKVLGGDRSFGKVLVRNATYHRVARHLVLARQTQFGVIAPFATPAGLPGAQSVPLPERFFGGGADSLRAFPYNQAGPRDTGAPLTPGGPSSEPTGFPLGGNALFFNNVELRFPLIGPNIQGVFFHDMGNVFSSLSNISFRFHQNNMQDFDYTVHAVGFGIRYRTPVGPVRLDLAYSINPPSYIGFSGTPQQLLQCNPNLPPQGVCVGTPQNISHFQFFFSIGQAF